MNACPSCRVAEGAIHRSDCTYADELRGLSRVQDAIKAAELVIIRAVTDLADFWPVDIEAVELEGISAEGMARLVYVCRLRVVVRSKKWAPPPLSEPTPSGPS